MFSHLTSTAVAFVTITFQIPIEIGVRSTRGNSARVYLALKESEWGKGKGENFTRALLPANPPSLRRAAGLFHPLNCALLPCRVRTLDRPRRSGERGDEAEATFSNSNCNFSLHARASFLVTLVAEEEFPDRSECACALRPRSIELASRSVPNYPRHHDLVAEA